MPPSNIPSAPTGPTGPISMQTNFPTMGLGTNEGENSFSTGIFILRIYFQMTIEVAAFEKNQILFEPIFIGIRRRKGDNEEKLADEIAKMQRTLPEGEQGNGD